MPAFLSREQFLALADELLARELMYGRGYVASNYLLPTGEGRLFFDRLAFGDKKQQDQETSCLAMHFCPPGRHRDELISAAKLLAVPLGFFGQVSGHVDVVQWRSDRDPAVIHTLSGPNEFQGFIRKEAEHLGANSMLEGKRPTGRQLTFADAGLLDFAFQAAPKDLPAVYQDVAAGAADQIRRLRPMCVDPRGAGLRATILVFGARVLKDKGELAADSGDALALLREAGSGGKFPAFFRTAHWQDIPPEVLSWIGDRLRRWRFEFLSPYGLGMLYQHAFVSDELRRELAIYYTPLAISQFIVDQLPIHEMPLSSRSALDPTAGSGGILLRALRRMKDLYRDEKGVQPAASWCRQMVHGRDKDPFACWIAALSLMIETRWNGWDIEQGDLSELKLQTIWPAPTIVIGNPPFELTRMAVGKAVSQLPDGGLVGLVLPYKYRGQVSGGGEASRRGLMSACEILRIADLPAGVFAEAAEPSMILLARKRAGGPRANWVISDHNIEGPVSEYRSRVLRGDFAARREMTQRDWMVQKHCLMRSPRLAELWARLSALVLSGACEKPHLGIQLRMKEAKEGEPVDPTLVQTPNPGGFVPFLRGTGGARSAFGLPMSAEISYLNYYARRDDIHRPRSHWDMEAHKVLIPRTIDTNYAWRLMAYVDNMGTFPENTFLYVIPKHSGNDIYRVAAVLNSTVANAWLAEHSYERNIIGGLLAELPWPPLEPLVAELVSELAFHLVRVQRQRSTIEHRSSGEQGSAWMDWVARQVLLRIDELVCAAYGPTENERSILSSLCPQEDRPGLPREVAPESVQLAAVRSRPRRRLLSTCGRVLVLDEQAGLAAVAVDGLKLGLPVPVRVDDLPADLRLAGAHIRLSASLAAHKLDDVCLAGIVPFPEADRSRSELLAELRRVTKPLPREVSLAE
ncbi:MAG: hypothetical protein FJ291_21400 [Planctomycetes bacterium]|nr:hypothetical protein [Planctomycetota bacterium]